MSAPTVLLIDRDQDSLAIYSLFLEHNGFRVLYSADGGEGFRLACEQVPDVIVTELFLPPVANRYVADLLKEDERTAAIPLVAITTLPLMSRSEAQLRLCDGFLAKPCVPSRMLEELNRFVAPSLLAS